MLEKQFHLRKVYICVWLILNSIGNRFIKFIYLTDVFSRSQEFSTYNDGEHHSGRKTDRAGGKPSSNPQVAGGPSQVLAEKKPAYM